ncbi:MAG: Ig-like domain-containing protein, partial [Planctomycetota bacterium]
AAFGLTLGLAADRFADYEIDRHGQRGSVPRVEQTFPIDGDTVPANLRAVRVELFLPTTGVGADPETATAKAVRLVDVASGELVASQATVAADGASVVLTPSEPLATDRAFRIEVTNKLRDASGQRFVPFTSTFTTSDTSTLPASSVAFERAETLLQLDRSIVTALVWQPGEGESRTLVAATADGRIFRYDVAPNGIDERPVVKTIPANNGGPRLVTGLAFDPRDSSRLWVSHTQMALTGADDFAGKLSVLSSRDFRSYEDRVVGLPRAYKDHANFDIAFDPTDPDTLFVSQGSNTGHGGRDTKWNNRPERLLTAAVLKVEVDRLPRRRPLDVRLPVERSSPFKGGDYDPTSASAAVTVHATGIRSGYDLLWHSSGRLLVAINGGTRGGNAPALIDEAGRVIEGPVMSVPVTTPDTLADVTQAGSYHGHPNPARGERVLMGGNPTDGDDPYEIPAYPIGTMPDPNFTMPVINFGKGFSVNGLFESTVGETAGLIWATRYSAGDDVVLVQVTGEPTVQTDIAGLTGLASPLNVVEDPRTGDLFVSEADANRLVRFKRRP